MMNKDYQRYNLSTIFLEIDPAINANIFSVAVISTGLNPLIIIEFPANSNLGGFVFERTGI